MPGTLPNLGHLSQANVTGYGIARCIVILTDELENFEAAAI